MQLFLSLDIFCSCRRFQNAEQIWDTVETPPSNLTSSYKQQDHYLNSSIESLVIMSSVVGFIKRIYGIFYAKEVAKSDGAIRIGLLGASNIA